MQLRFQDYPNFIACYKPYGVRTHAVNESQLGFSETISEKLRKELYVVHRLDSATSGLILFAKDKSSAQRFFDIFEKHQIQKTYLFLTDQKIELKEFTAKSWIEKKDNQFISRTGQDFNAETDFKCLKYFPESNYWLWQANPKTGKPHQIRLHAADFRIPILGDNAHGGSPFYRLALHAESLQFNWANQDYSIRNETSPLFLDPTKSELNLLLLDNWHSRHQLYQINPNESYRLVHKESNQFRADVYGDHLWIYDYSQSGLKVDQINIFKKFAEQKKIKLIIRHMLNRGTGVGGKEESTLLTDSEVNWITEENKIKYLLKTNSGFSPGLFLDQRENRLWVKENSDGKNVLNLFSYTSGFSLNAALGKAQQVTSVDVSKNFLDWSKENFKLNNVNPNDYEFFFQDSLLFLKGAIKRNRKWDLIICDPPSFGRSKEGVWRIEKDLPDLAEMMVSCLSNKGKILFTCNYEGWTLEELKLNFTKKIKKGSYHLQPLPYLGLDFEVTDSRTNLMKGFILS